MMNNANTEEKKDKKRKILIIILIFGIVVCFALTIWALFFRDTNDPLTPDYAPGVSESNATPVEGDGSKLDVPDGGGGISIEYVSAVSVDLSENKASFVYTHPAKSTQNIVLQIVVKDTVIAQSGLIAPGNQLKELPLLKGAAKKLAAGTYTDAQFKILSYDPESGEKAMVDTVAQITVTVQE